jgi:hypothetical protein
MDSIAQLKTGKVSVRSILTDTPRALAPVRVYTLLLATPHLGESGMRRVLESANVWPTVRVGALTIEQRHAIRDALPSRVK